MTDDEWCDLLYGLPMRSEPWAHQWRELRDHWETLGRALLWQMRTGKTKAVIDLACRLHVAGRIDAVLVVAPNGVHRQWVTEQFPRHVWPRIRWVGHFWSSSDRSHRTHQEALAGVLEAVRATEVLVILAVNSEALDTESVKKALRAFVRGGRHRILGVFDESQDFRTPGSKRSFAARSLRKRLSYSRILTGTPVDNSPLHAWSQFELVNPGCLGFSTFGEFKDAYARYERTYGRGGRAYPRLAGYKNLEDLRTRLAGHSSVVLREDCEDLPPLLKVPRFFEAHPQVRELYRRVRDQFVADLETGQVVGSVDAGVRFVKLRQILSGFVVDELGEVLDVVPDEENPRLDALVAELDGWPSEKVIVWCVFREDIRRVVGRLQGVGRKVVEYHGGVDSETRHTALKAFRDDPEVTVFVGQPKAGGRGLDLSAASLVVWYSHTSDLVDRRQADERATVKGGRTVTVVDIVTIGATPDSRALEMLEQKAVVADQVTGTGLRDLLGLLRSDNV